MEYTIIKTNIVNVVTDAVVLPANEMLKEGSGTSAAIFKAAGRKKLSEECKSVIGKVGKLEVGDSIPTSGYNLHSKYIIHSIVPKWNDGNSKEYELLSTAYLSALNIADMLNCESIAFPLMASGNNGFDIEVALEVAKQSIASFDGHALKQVVLVIYSDSVASIVKEQGILYIEISDQTVNAQRNPINNIKIPGVVAKDMPVKVFDYLKDAENRKKIIAAGETIAALAIAIKKKDGKEIIKMAKNL